MGRNSIIPESVVLEGSDLSYWAATDVLHRGKIPGSNIYIYEFSSFIAHSSIIFVQQEIIPLIHYMLEISRFCKDRSAVSISLALVILGN